MTKLCKDCVHCKLDKFGWLKYGNKFEFARCHHPEVVTPGTVNPVSGKAREESPGYCESERKPFMRCKPNAVLFEAKAGAA